MLGYVFMCSDIQIYDKHTIPYKKEISAFNRKEEVDTSLETIVGAFHSFVLNNETKILKLLNEFMIMFSSFISYLGFILMWLFCIYY